MSRLETALKHYLIRYELQKEIEEEEKRKQSYFMQLRKKRFIDQFKEEMEQAGFKVRIIPHKKD